MKQNTQEQQLADVEKGKINLETAKITWKELERFFAAGAVVYVAPELVLIDVAHALSQDDAEQFKLWMNDGKVEHVSDRQAIKWHEDDATVWSVVVKPWVLVQDISED
ncbi:MAG: hypothetical protein COC05_00135 [Gammaproteobacteria bacterium]|nr:DUF2288 domain-containing protein [Beggiatoa alba]PCH61595.1 MAG: hypothetical protein COC05_00135 [Gammaproteobacteria bacterium]